MVNHCTSICEFMHKFTNFKDLEKYKSNRFYIGSNFCSIYFVKNTPKFLKTFGIYFYTNNIKCTLCIPNATEKYADDLRNTVKEILSSYSFIDEVSVNDFGMLSHIKENFDYIKINIGRCMNKYQRDIRFDKYTNQERVIDDRNLLILNGVTGYDFDVSNKIMNFNSFSKEVHIYTPYVYASVGNICEYASINKDTEHKFRPNDSCDFGCEKVITSYLTKQGIVYYKIGKEIFYKFDKYEIKCNKDYRIINDVIDNVIMGALKNE